MPNFTDINPTFLIFKPIAEEAVLNRRLGAMLLMVLFILMN